MIELTNSEKVYLILERNNIPYTPIITIQIDKEIDLTILRESIKDIFDRYSILRSIIKHQDKKLYLNENEFEINLLFKTVTQNKEISIESVLSEIINIPFNVYNDPIIYLYYIIINQKFYLTIRWFHALFDGKSALILLNQVLNTYIKKINNEIVELPEIKRVSFLDIIRDFKYIRDGVKIGSRFKLIIKGLMILIKLARVKGTGGLFNREDIYKGRLLFKTLNLTEDKIHRLNSLKQKYNLTDNDLISSIIIQAYINSELINSNKKIQTLTFMDIRPRNEKLLLGDLVTGFYVVIDSNEIKDEITLIKKVKKQFDKEKKTANAIANVYIGEIQNLTLEKLRKYMKNVFKISNMQITNVGNLDNIFDINQHNKIKILWASYFVPIKPELSSVLAITKANNVITIGLSYLENVLLEAEVDNFFNQINSVINKLGSC